MPGDETQFKHPWALHVETNRYVRPSDVCKIKEASPDERVTLRIGDMPLSHVKRTPKRQAFFRSKEGVDAMHMCDRAGHPMTREHLATQTALLNLKGDTIVLHHDSLEDTSGATNCLGHEYLVIDTLMEEHLLESEKRYYIDNVLVVVKAQPIRTLLGAQWACQEFDYNGNCVVFKNSPIVVQFKRIAVEVFVTHATGSEKFTALNRSFDFVVEVQVTKSDTAVPTEFHVKPNAICRQNLRVINLDAGNEQVKLSERLCLHVMSSHCKAQLVAKNIQTKDYYTQIAARRLHERNAIETELTSLRYQFKESKNKSEELSTCLQAAKDRERKLEKNTEQLKLAASSLKTKNDELKKKNRELSDHGTKVVSGSLDRTVRIWDAVTGECEQTLQGHSDYVMSASFSPDGTKVVSGSWDETLRIWDAVTGECEQTLEGHSEAVYSASFSRDGTKVVSGSDDKTVRIWDAVTGECEQTLQGHSEEVNSATFSPDGTKVVSGSQDRTVRIWDAVTGECEQTLEGHSSPVNSATFSPDGTKVVSGSRDRTVRIWDAVTGECEQTLEGHSDWVRSASFSPDGTKVVSGSDDQTVRIWDAVTGECEQTLEGHSHWVSSASFGAQLKKQKRELENLHRENFELKSTVTQLKQTLESFDLGEISKEFETLQAENAVLRKQLQLVRNRQCEHSSDSHDEPIGKKLKSTQSKHNSDSNSTEDDMSTLADLKLENAPANAGCMCPVEYGGFHIDGQLPVPSTTKDYVATKPKSAKQTSLHNYMSRKSR